MTPRIITRFRDLDDVQTPVDGQGFVYDSVLGALVPHALAFGAAANNGKWLKTVGGALAWTALTSADVGLGSVTNDVQLKAADLDADVTLAADSATKIATQHATKTIVGTKVAGPASAVDNRVAVFDGVTGKTIKDGGATLSTRALLCDIQTFTGNGTWSKPSGAKTVKVRCVGGGGSGGGGQSVSSANGDGGGGGGGGACPERMFEATDLTDTIAVTVGAQVAGGVHDANGNAGNPSSFGGYLTAYGGGGGSKGLLASGPASGGGGGGSGSAGGAGVINVGSVGGSPRASDTAVAAAGLGEGGAGGTYAYAHGAAAEAGGGAGGRGGVGGSYVGMNGGCSLRGGGGGGGGAEVMVTSASTAGAGGATSVWGNGGGGTAPGGAGNAGTSIKSGAGGGGGSGWRSDQVHDGGAGGAGGAPGGGGGGGGAARTGGAGGAGGRGEVRVTTWF